MGYRIRLHVGIFVAAILYIGAALFAVVAVTVELFEITDVWPSLIPQEEFESPYQYALHLSVGFHPIRLGVFYLINGMAIFVAVLLIVAEVASVSSLFRPFIWFSAILLFVNLAELIECIWAILRVEKHEIIAKEMSEPVFRCLMQFAIARVVIFMLVAESMWTAMRSRTVVRREYG